MVWKFFNLHLLIVYAFKGIKQQSIHLKKCNDNFCNLEN
jgi:hypothetical protein